MQITKVCSPAFGLCLPVRSFSADNAVSSTPLTKRRWRRSVRPPVTARPLSFAPKSVTSCTRDGDASNSSSEGPPSSPLSFEQGDDVLPSHLNALRRQKLALHLIDLIFRIVAEFPHPLPSTLSPLLSQIEQVAKQMYPDPLMSPPSDQLQPHFSDVSTAHHDKVNAHDSELRATARLLLWRVRKALYPLCPSSSLRTALELTRSACLHTPAQSSIPISSFSYYAYAVQLSIDIVLLQELHKIRLSERTLHECVVRHHGRNWPGFQLTSDAATQLSVDDHSVRGKKRLSDAVSSLVSHITELYSLHPNVTLALNDLNEVLRASRLAQRRRRPTGYAMLLRPRISDIPNFDRVTDTLLRGGQPSQAGLQWLYDYGVTVIVDLRGSDRRNQWLSSSASCRFVNVLDGVIENVDDIISHPDSSRAQSLHQPSSHSTPIPAQKSEPSRGLLSICSIPIEDLGTPTWKQLDQFISLVDSIHEKDGVVFVHCKAGIGRTGTLIACWRIFHGMAVDQALAAEQLYSDFGGGLCQETFIRQYGASLLSDVRVDSNEDNQD